MLHRQKMLQRRTRKMLQRDTPEMSHNGHASNGLARPSSDAQSAHFV
jgi:hypothetical protein